MPTTGQGRGPRSRPGPRPVAVLQVADRVRDDLPDAARCGLGEVGDQRLGRRLAEQAQQGYHDQQAREDRQHRVVGQSGGAVAQRVVGELMQRPLGRCQPRATLHVRRAGWDIVARTLVKSYRAVSTGLVPSIRPCIRRGVTCDVGQGIRVGAQLGTGVSGRVSHDVSLCQPSGLGRASLRLPCAVPRSAAALTAKTAP
jgi:hypothetical protein